MNVGRATTEEERALFYETFADAKPIKPGAKIAARPKKKAAAAKAAKPAKTATRPKVQPKVTPVAEAPPEIGGHRTTPLKRGRLEPEARLDLHGLTQDAAHKALARFLSRARASGARVVLVITGKSGVLNREFKRWLSHGELAPLVSGVSAAHKRHGGGGAFYVLLRKMPEARGR